jgi:D-3-phosphoglycerate dehydrogenase
MKLLIASSIHQHAIERLTAVHDVTCSFDASEAQLQSLMASCEALILRSGVQITASVLAAAPNLELIVRAGSGYDNIDLEYVSTANIRLVRIPGPGAKAVAELTFALMLTLARNVLIADRLLRQGHWAKHQMTGYLLTGKILGIIGAGNIGSRVGQLGHAWGMEVLGCVEHPNQEKAERLAGNGIRLTDCDEVLEKADFVSIHVPLKASTRYLIGAKELGKMNQGAYLINMARGGIVNEAELYEALAHGRLSGAAVDVHEHEGNGQISPLVGLDNIVLTPHIGAATFDSQREIGDLVVETITAFDNRKTAGVFADERIVVHI